jgi:predicted membrane-bound mannosyltransferase
VTLGLYGAFWWDGVDWAVAVAVPVGVALVVGYNLELLGGRLHSDLVFGLGWGGFPVAVGYLAQAPDLTSPNVVSALAAVGAAVALTYAQRRLSTPARDLRRRTRDVEGVAHRLDGTAVLLDRQALLAPLEGGLRALSWAVPLVALAVLLTHA